MRVNSKNFWTRLTNFRFIIALIILTLIVLQKLGLIWNH